MNELLAEAKKLINDICHIDCDGYHKAAHKWMEKYDQHIESMATPPPAKEVFCENCGKTDFTILCKNCGRKREVGE